MDDLSLAITTNNTLNNSFSPIDIRNDGTTTYDENDRIEVILNNAKQIIEMRDSKCSERTPQKINGSNKAQEETEIKTEIQIQKQFEKVTKWIPTKRSSRRSNIVLQAEAHLQDLSRSRRQRYKNLKYHLTTPTPISTTLEKSPGLHAEDFLREARRQVAMKNKSEQKIILTKSNTEKTKDNKTETEREIGERSKSRSRQSCGFDQRALMEYRQREGKHWHWETRESNSMKDENENKKAKTKYVSKCIGFLDDRFMKEYGKQEENQGLQEAHERRRVKEEEEEEVVGEIEEEKKFEMNLVIIDNKIRSEKKKSSPLPPKTKTNTSLCQNSRLCNESDNITNNSNSIMSNNSERRMIELLEELRVSKKRQKKLEKQLQQAGLRIIEDEVTYEEAKEQVRLIAEKMQMLTNTEDNELEKDMIAAKDAKLRRQEYFLLEQKMEKYSRALELSDEYIAEQEQREKKWEQENYNENQLALQLVWKHIPVNFRQHSVDEWLSSSPPTPLSTVIPKPFILKFARTNILQLLRLPPELIGKMHPCNFEQLSITGLTLTERRALYAHLHPIALQYWAPSTDTKTMNQTTQRKWEWHMMMRNNFKEVLQAYQCHVTQFLTKKKVTHREGSINENIEEMEKVEKFNHCACKYYSKKSYLCPVLADQKLNYYLHDYGCPCDLNQPEYQTIGSSESPSSSLQPREYKTHNNEKTREKESVMDFNQEEQQVIYVQWKNNLKEHYNCLENKSSLVLLQTASAHASCVFICELTEKLESYLDEWIQDERLYLSLFLDSENRDKSDSIVKISGNCNINMNNQDKAQKMTKKFRIALVELKLDMAQILERVLDSKNSLPRSHLEFQLVQQLSRIVSKDFLAYIRKEQIKQFDGGHVNSSLQESEQSEALLLEQQIRQFLSEIEASNLNQVLADGQERYEENHLKMKIRPRKTREERNKELLRRFQEKKRKQKKDISSSLSPSSNKFDVCSPGRNLGNNRQHQQKARGALAPGTFLAAISARKSKQH